MNTAFEITVSDVITILGSETIQDRCQVGEFSVRAAKREGKFPASWFDGIETALTELGHKCPRSLFAFKGAQGPTEITQ